METDPLADPYEVNDEEVINRDFNEYEMPKYDKQSIEEIRKKVKKKNYKTTREIESHQEFLETMTNNLLEISQNEKKIDKVNWALDRQIEDIKALYFELERLRKEKLKK